MNDERKAAEKRDVNLKFKPIDEREWKKAIKIEHKGRLPECSVVRECECVRVDARWPLHLALSPFLSSLL